MKKKESNVRGINYYYNFENVNADNKNHKSHNCMFIFEDGDKSYMSHLFHFLEYIHASIFVLFDLKIDEQSVSAVAFPKLVNQAWRGKYFDHNCHLLTALFPNLEKIYDRDEYLKTNLQASLVVKIEREAMDHFNINKMNAALFDRLPHYFFEKKLENIYNYFQVDKLMKNNKPVVTYIARSSGPRVFNQNVERKLEELLSSLKKIIYNKVYMERFSFEEQVKIAYTSEVIIGIHGNGLSHALFMKPFSTLVEIFPKNSFAYDYYSLCKVKNIDYFGFAEKKPLTAVDYIFSPNVNRKICGINCDGIEAIINQKILFYGLA